MEGQDILEALTLKIQGKGGKSLNHRIIEGLYF